MTKYHVVVSGSRPEKDSQNKYLPMPKENVEFIKNTLALLPADDYAFIYHGAAVGVDSVADDYAFENGIRLRQYPAYWFDPSKPNNVDKGAGFFRNERMLRDAKSAVWNKEDEVVVLLAFHSKPLVDSRGTNHTVEMAKKIGGITVRTYELPIQANVEVKDAAPSSNVPF